LLHAKVLQKALQETGNCRAFHIFHKKKNKQKTAVAPKTSRFKRLAHQRFLGNWF
jgi:hypothetical protein